jgi:hypothetical protein
MRVSLRAFDVVIHSLGFVSNCRAAETMAAAMMHDELEHCNKQTSTLCAQIGGKPTTSLRIWGAGATEFD